LGAVVGDIEGIIASVLHGAAKILGCDSASLIVIDEAARSAILRVGTVAGSSEGLAEVEGAVGRLKGASFPLDRILESVVYASWRDRAVLEAESLLDLAAGVIDRDMLAPVAHLVGERRFICVPALAGGRCHGIMAFDKVGLAPFSPQQRELLIRYARRVAEILETPPGEAIAGPPGAGQESAPADLYFLVDARGDLAGGPGDGNGDDRPSLPLDVNPSWMRGVRARARRMIAERTRGRVMVEPPASGDDRRVRFRADLLRIRARGEEFVLVSLVEIRPHPGPDGHQLVQVALRENAAAVLVAPDLRITSCSAATESLFGYATGELTGRPAGVLFRDASDVRTILDHQFLFLTSGYFEEGTVLRRKDGRTFPGRVEALLLADSSDQVIGFLVLIRDTSAPAGSKGETDGLDRLMRRERLATLGELAAQLAHEIRNPLVAIGATLESVAGDLPRGSDSAAVLAGLQGEITRMDMVLKDYLSMAARHNASVAMVDVGEVIDDARRLLDASRRTPARPGTGVPATTRTISSRVPPGLTVLADREGLRHVFFNLMLNALEAMPGGGEITCDASATRRQVTIHVDDTGPGISGDPADCFEPFYTTKKHGTGLGLTVCQKVVAAHGGRITLRNRPGGGCRATIVLPRRVDR
jgi:PAS domain S-box-containing protein